MTHPTTTIAAIVLNVIIGAGVAGWCLNIVRLFLHGSAYSTGEIIMRLVGIPLAPLGAIVGWL